VADAAALWVVHAWTIDASDISPFFVLVSPTKRCGKTSMLILLMYLTPKSELASNISPSALFRYIEHTHPTLLIDEADSFVGASEEMRGILNSGHTRIAANVIRNVEINGEHKPKRFSVWAAKAIATIRDLPIRSKIGQLLSSCSGNLKPPRLPGYANATVRNLPRYAGRHRGGRKATSKPWPPTPIPMYPMN
jgi:hypothetical protein